MAETKSGRAIIFPRDCIFFPKQLFLSIDNGLKAALQSGLNKLFATICSD
jgi:hypothetical protein